MRRIPTAILSAIFLLTLATAGSADVSKLDPHARAAAAAVRAGASVAQLRASRTSVSDAGALDVFITGTASRAELEAMGITVRTYLPGVCTAFVPVGVLDALAERAEVTGIRAAVACETSNDSGIVLTGAAIERAAGPTFAGINGAGVLVGDVDTGIDVHHADFQDASGKSRILYVWDQNNTTSVSPPAGYGYGHEWTKADIDGGLCTEIDAGTGGGHGSHVMGTIAGNGSKSTATQYQYAGMAPMADIAMVATNFYDTGVLDGVNWVFQKATALGKKAVVNLSLGKQYGPHDGSDAFESGLDALCGAGRLVCVSAGNDGGSNIHGGMLVPAAGDSMKFTFSNAGFNYYGAEFNGWYDAPDNMTVVLRSPGGFLITVASGGSYGTLSSTTGWPTTSTGVNGNVYMENGITHATNGARLVYLLIESTGTGTGDITGTWTLRCTPTSQAGSTTRIDMWRDWISTTALGAVFSLKNTNDHLVFEPACARKVITVGAYQSRYNWDSCLGPGYHFNSATQANSGRICVFSNVGPTRDGRNKPDIVAPGSAIISALSADLGLSCANGIIADGPAHQAMQGTSMAAPHVTGAVALLLQCFGALTPDQVKAYLSGHATIDASTGAPWNATYGNGKLHLPDLRAGAGVPPPASGGLWLAAPAPNPSNGVVALRFTLPRAGHAALEVFGVGGERVWSQEWANLPAGPHSYAWDGLTSAHQRVGSGLYYVRLTTNAGVRRTRLVRLR